MQLYAAGVVDRGATPEDYRITRLDAISGAVFACLISITMIIATGAAIGGQGLLDSAKQAAQALRPVAGPGAELLFAIGLLGASALAAAVVPLSSSYAISEAIGVERSVSRRFREAPLFLGLFTAQVILGVTIALTPLNLIKLLIGIQVLQGIVAPIVLTYILILTNGRSVPGPAASTPLCRIAATVVVVAVAGMSLLLVGQPFSAPYRTVDVAPNSSAVTMGSTGWCWCRHLRTGDRSKVNTPATIAIPLAISTAIASGLFVKRSPKATAPMRMATDGSSVSMIGSENAT